MVSELEDAESVGIEMMVGELMDRELLVDDLRDRRLSDEDEMESRLNMPLPAVRNTVDALRLGGRGGSEVSCERSFRSWRFIMAFRERKPVVVVTSTAGGWLEGRGGMDLRTAV